MEREPNLIKLGPMSECSVGGDAESQKKCRFREKSSHSEKCMHCVMGDEFCDSLGAQKNAEEALTVGKTRVNLQEQKNQETTSEISEESIEAQPTPPEKKFKPSRGKISFE